LVKRQPPEIKAGAKGILKQAPDTLMPQTDLMQIQSYL